MAGRLLAVLQLLLAFLALGGAQSTKEEKLMQASENPSLVAWIVIGTIAATTMSVLIVLVPTLLYYKYKDSQEVTEIDTIKK